ncbi:hypothetical protein [Escherichia marmotae]|uniref:hypothetical protein n=1 Tax=Escherichia marmotae TaxID=1499973 RepID=UPI001E3F1C03|nr:hypothetical protein [Escherichia marmotae]MED0631201.1 hypothetical protein [Escherichia marmotae]
MQSLKITQTIKIIQNNRNLSLIRLLQTTIVNLFWLYFIWLLIFKQTGKLIRIANHSTHTPLKGHQPAAGGKNGIAAVLL